MYAVSRSTSRRITIFGVTMLAIAVVAAGCDSSDVPGDTLVTTTTPSTQEVETEKDVSVNVPNPTQPVVTEPASACRRLTDFEDSTGLFIVNDGVMGGRSNGSFDVTDSVLSFTGDVVTAGGGFTSVRFLLAGGELSGSSSVALRVRADERVYGLWLEDDARANGRSVVHRAELDTTGAVEDGWQIVTLAYADLTPSVFGRNVDAPPFNPDTAREFGISIADGTDGEFALDIDWIDVCDE